MRKSRFLRLPMPHVVPSLHDLVSGRIDTLIKKWTGPAQWIGRFAGLPAEANQVDVEGISSSARHQWLHSVIGLVRISRPDEAQSITDSVDVCINGKDITTEGEDQHTGCRLPAYPIHRQKIIHDLFV